jgi:hypothetical protein
MPQDHQVDAIHRAIASIAEERGCALKFALNKHGSLSRQWSVLEWRC